MEVPLLFETGMDAAFDGTLAVVAEDDARVSRAGARGTNLLEGRSDRQLTQDEKAARADYVIRNDGSLEELGAEVEGLMPALTGLARGVA